MRKRSNSKFDVSITTLDSIKSNHLSLTCSCGHHCLLPVEYLLETLSADTPVKAVLGMSRCTKCGAKGQAAHRIIYVGGSWEALEGNRQPVLEAIITMDQRPIMYQKSYWTSQIRLLKMERFYGRFQQQRRRWRRTSRALGNVGSI